MEELVRYALYGIPLFVCFYLLETLFIILSIKNIKKAKRGKFYYKASELMNKLYHVAFTIGMFGFAMYCLEKLV